MSESTNRIEHKTNIPMVIAAKAAISGMQLITPMLSTVYFGDYVRLAIS